MPGTGTWDGMASVEYSLRGKAWGTSLSVLARYNGTMDDGYRLGHGGCFSATVFRIITIKSVQLLPSAGMYLQALMTDVIDGVPDETTGGTTVFSDPGMQLWYQAFGLAINWQQALHNDLGAQMVPNKARLIAGLTYSFNTD